MCMYEFFPPADSVSCWDAAFERDSQQCFHRFFYCKENDRATGEALLHHILPELSDSQVEALWKIQVALGDDAMSGTQIKEWYKRLHISGERAMLWSFINLPK